MKRTSLTSAGPRRSLYYGWVLITILGLTTILSYGTTEYLFGLRYSFPGNPDRYPLRDEVSAYLLAYAAHFQLPIFCQQKEDW